MRKPAFCICENSAFVFATRIVPSLYFLNPKFQASSHLLWLYSRVGNPENRFSHDAAHFWELWHELVKLKLVRKVEIKIVEA